MGKVSVVTGGTAGIGAGIVKKILEHSGKDDKVFVNYGHNEERAGEFLEQLSLENREKVVLLKADLSSYGEDAGVCVRNQSAHRSCGLAGMQCRCGNLCQI